MALLRRKTKVDEGEKYFAASQWRLMWWKFRKHKLAVASAVVLVMLYLVAIFSEFVSPRNTRKRNSDYIYAPQQKIHFFGEDGFHLRPFVYAFKPGVIDENWMRTYEIDTSKKLFLGLFVRGDKYKMWGLFESDLHLFGVAGDEPFFLLGTDYLGRDMLSRILYGSRISLSIGLVGIFLSLVIGCLIGGISGYFSGTVDNIIQRLIETLMCLPKIPLWMGLSAALPANWSPALVYFGIVVILSLLGWTGLARVVRGKIIALREEDFAMAARLAGAKEMWIIRKHLLPSFYSYIIVSLTLSIPGMILAETTLSYLGIGLRPPAISWGVLLQQAQSLKVISQNPWILSPGIFIILTVLAFNFVGDGLRDAADPYSR